MSHYCEMSRVWPYIVTFVGGVATSLLATFIWERMGKSRRHRRITRTGRQALLYEPNSDGWFRVAGWSPDKPLSEQNLKVKVSRRRPPFGWVQPAVWRENLQIAREQFSGHCGYVTDCEGVDWRESEQSQRLVVTISACDYAEGIATWESLRSDGHARDQVAVALTEDPLAFIRTAPPCPLAVNIGVLNHDGRKFLGLLRSATVATGRNIWTVGPCETLTIADHASPGSKQEDFFALTRRGLQEELGLSVGDCGPISISWFGYFASDAHPWIFAQVRVLIPDEAVLEKWQNCHSTDEAVRGSWLPFDKETIRGIINGKREVGTGEGAQSKDRLIEAVDNVLVEHTAAKGRWIIHAPHAANELWRMQSVL